MGDLDYLRFYEEGYDSYDEVDMFKPPPCPYFMCTMESAAWCDGWECAEADDFEGC